MKPIANMTYEELIMYFLKSRGVAVEYRIAWTATKDEKIIAGPASNEKVVVWNALQHLMIGEGPVVEITEPNKMWTPQEPNPDVLERE